MSAAKFKIESGVQLLARLTKKPDIIHFYPELFQSGSNCGDVIEISSDGWSISHLLLDVISEALKQSSLSNIPFGILIFNTDGNINYEALFTATKKKICSDMLSRNLCMADSALEASLKDTMANLYVVDIYDATQFYTTIYNLENILMEYSNISLLIFNTLTAFYWSEQGFKITRMDLYLKNLINIIQKITKEYKTVCLYTRPEYFCTNKDVNIPVEIKYQIQLLENSNNVYQVNVKSTGSKTTKFFKVINTEILWL